MKTRRLFVGAAVIVIVGATMLLSHNNDADGVNQSPANSSANNEQAVADEHPAFNKTQHSIGEPSSIWVIVNKQRPLPEDYIPEPLRNPNVNLRSSNTAQEMKLRNDAAHALESLFNAAAHDGHKLMLASGYRSHSYQHSLYSRYVREDGQAAADRYSARPGFSEHQTGLAADVAPANRTCVVEECFADTPEGKWVAAHAYEYGFTVRYAKGKEAVVGYMYEPWHLRYVGVELATELHRSDSAMEEYFELPAAPNYQ